MKKSVDVKKYNTAYFETVLQAVNYTNKVSIQDFKPIHRYIASLVRLKKQEHVIDYGCGNGDLAFLLAMKYRCKVTGIDYSADAIKIAHKNKRQLERSGSLKSGLLSFKTASIDRSPTLHGISAVYLADVIEHLYDEEIDRMLKLFERWNNKDLKIIIHTDNNAYLRFVRPALDKLSILLGKTSDKAVKKRNQWEKERHVNLTTPRALTKKMRQYGYKIVKFSYSPVNRKKIQAQLGSLGEIPFLTTFIVKASAVLTFLLPSFYIVYQKNNES